jgi:transmembrane sensor
MSTTLQDALKKEVDARAIDAAWDRIRARRDRPRTARRVMFVVPALAVAALLVFVLKTFLFTSAPATQPIALSTGAPLPDEWSAPASEGGKVIALDDGSRLEIDAATKLRRTTTKTDPTRVELTLESGATTFDVKPGGPRMWVIDAGGVVVRVLGTRFRVERSGSSVDVKVERGKVSVEGAGVEGGAKLLLAGDAIHVEPPKHAQATAAPPSPVASFDAPAIVGTRAIAERPTSAHPAMRAAPPAKEALSKEPASTAREKKPDTDNAGVAASPDSTKPAAPASATVEAPSPAPPRSSSDPMTTADAARRAGRPREAVTILVALVEAKDARAPLAAFTLGKIHAEDLGDHATAAVWFERAIAFGLPRGLDEEAQARVVECHAKAGRRVDAARAATRYEASFPNGRHLDRVRGFVQN